MDNIREARTQFRSIDTNGDGSLDLGELSNGLSEFGLTDAGIEAIFFDLDVNNDGRVSEEEYVAWAVSIRRDQEQIDLEDPKQRRMAFLLEDLSTVESTYHTDKQQQAEANPSNTTARKEARADAQATFKALDTDGDGNCHTLFHSSPNFVACSFSSHALARMITRR